MTRAAPGRVIRGIFALQLAIGLALVWGDISAGVPRLQFGPAAPDLDQPVRPGDQTRRYAPRERRDVPNRPFPATPDMPDRLAIETARIDGRPVLRMIGQIAPGDGDRVPDLLAEQAGQEAAPAALLLNSPGGSVSDALAIGRAIRRLDLRTEVAAGDVCFSACPYLLAGGTTRAVDPAGAVGVHQHYFGESGLLPAFLAVEDVQHGQGVVMAYLDEMGVDPLLMQPALTTPPDEIYILLPAELARYALVREGPADSAP